MTHAALGEKGRREIGITDGLVRISVGIENVEDIQDDLGRRPGRDIGPGVISDSSPPLQWRDVVGQDGRAVGAPEMYSKRIRSVRTRRAHK